MENTLERPRVTKKRSESRKHTGMIRVTQEALESATLAAALEGLSLADYCTKVLIEASNRDKIRGAKKLLGKSGTD